MVYMGMKHLSLRMIWITAVCCLMAACGPKPSNENGGDAFMSITAKEAKEIMESESNYVVLDVRTQEEYEEGHIAGAVLIPDYEIAERAEERLTNKEQLILVYCRSGRRSKSAAAELTAMGYKNIREFGGILDWPYDIEK